MKTKSIKRSLTIFGLFCGIMILVAVPLFAIPDASDTSANSDDFLETSSVDLSKVEIRSADQVIEFGEYGLMTVNDYIVYANNGSDAVSHIYYTVNNELADELRYIGAQTESGGSLSVQTSATRLNGHKTYIIYLNNALMPAQTVNIKIKSVFADILTISGSFSTQVCSYKLSAVPFAPYKIIHARSTIYAPSGASLGEFNPEGDTVGSTGMRYERSNQDPFAIANITGSYTYNENPVLRFTSLKREIHVNSWGFIRVVEKHSIKNTGNLSVSQYQWTVPKDAMNISANDFIGDITGLQMNNAVNSDGKTKNVTMDLTNNRSPMTAGTLTGYIVQYTLPIDVYFSKDFSTAALKINIHLLTCDFLIESEITEIYLFAGKSIVTSTIEPDLIDFGDNSLILRYSNEDLVGLESQPLYIEYKESGFQLIYSPLIYSLIILAVLSAYVIIRNNAKGKEETTAFREDVIPKEEIREFVTLYEEINAIRIDMKQLDNDLARRKMKKREYTKSRKMLDNKLKDTKEEIQSFKKFLMNKGGRFADIIQKLDLYEAQMIANEDGIKLDDER